MGTQKNHLMLWVLKRTISCYGYSKEPSHVMGTQKNHLMEMVLLSTQNKCFIWWIRKQLYFYSHFFAYLLIYDPLFTTGMCGGGLTSTDGKPPCTACPKGTYYYNSTYCADCPNGYTTEYVGSLNSNACRLTASIRGNLNKFKRQITYILLNFLMPRSHIHGSPRRFYYGLNITDDPGNANFCSLIQMHYIRMIKYY